MQVRKVNRIYQIGNGFIGAVLRGLLEVVPSDYSDHATSIGHEPVARRIHGSERVFDRGFRGQEISGRPHDPHHLALSCSRS